MSWKRTALFPGATILAVAFVTGCADVPPTEPTLEEGDVLFGGGVAEHLPTLDEEFVRISREIPGFGGWYYDASGRLNVVMAPAAPSLSATEMRSRLAANLTALGEDAAAAQTAVVKAGQYDFAALDAMHRQVMNVLGIPGVVYTDADEVANRVAVGVSNATAAEAVQHAVGMLGVPREAVVVRTTSPVQAMVGQPGTMTNHTLRDRIRPTAGGLEVTGAFVCTLGFNVRSPTHPAQGFVTSHHCTQTPGAVTGQVFWQPTSAAGNRIGWEVRDTAFFTGGSCPAGRRCRRSDSAGIRYDAGVSNAFARIFRTTGVNTGSLEIDPANPMFNITAERSFPSVGNTMHKVGRGTGWTSGTVSQSCVAINLDPDITYQCQEITTGAAGIMGPGDAGAPVFEPFPAGQLAEVRLVGMAWGSIGADGFVWSAMIEIRANNPARPAAQGGAWRTFPPPPAP
jgi:hypothetical protein